MLVGDDDIREKNIYSPFTKRVNNNSTKRPLSTCRGWFFHALRGASLGNSSRHWGRVVLEQAGDYPGRGRFPEGRITKAVIECQIGQAGGNIYASSHGTVTAKLGQFVGFVANRLIIQFRHQQPPTAMNQIM